MIGIGGLNRVVVLCKVQVRTQVQKDEKHTYTRHLHNRRGKYSHINIFTGATLLLDSSCSQLTRYEPCGTYMYVWNAHIIMYIAYTFTRGRLQVCRKSLNIGQVIM